MRTEAAEAAEAVLCDSIADRRVNDKKMTTSSRFAILARLVGSACVNNAPLEKY